MTEFESSCHSAPVEFIIDWCCLYCGKSCSSIPQSRIPVTMEGIIENLQVMRVPESSATLADVMRSVDLLMWEESLFKSMDKIREKEGSTPAIEKGQIGLSLKWEQSK